ncbi:MAG TPA: hypothetical protein VFS52_10145 [Steroidobacteraceae bacterium]|jgi:hypothetical protein|nr:hypothetical protein [Steroidobacteraceae bacterium]
MRALAIAILLTSSAVAAATPDFSGIWLPDPARAEPWPTELPLTPAARAQMQAFDPATRDPISFCMPFGTPRNTLATDSAIEIIQTPGRLTLIFQPDLSNVETRRVYLDGRTLPAEPDPSWFGTSIGTWDGDTLVIETVGIETDALVSGNGLPHSDALRIVERLRIENEPGAGKVLIDEMTLHDSKAYTAPIVTRRYFTWAPNAPLRESHCAERLWIDKLWRDRLAEHARARSSTVPKSAPEGEGR